MRKETKGEPVYAIGVDIGGTSIRSGLVSAKGRIRRGSFHRVPVNSKGPKEEILETFVLPLRKNLKQAKEEGLKVVGIGVGMCGPLDYPKGICLIKGVDKYESLYGTNLKEEFRRRLNLPDSFPMEFEIDTWDFARGEAWRGNARGFRRILALTLGTGLGSAFIADGELLADGPGVPPPYGWIGSLPYRDKKMDDMFSSRGILGLYFSLSQDSSRKGLSVKDIAVRAKRGDSLCIKVFQEFGKLLGEALAPILKEFGAECLLFGGQISKSFDLFSSSLKRELAHLRQLKRVTVARSINRAGVLGSAYRILTRK